MSADPRRRIVENPFYVLGLPVGCSRIEVEREGQKLIGMLELGLSSARTYRSPLGEHARTPEAVRAAMAELRDPGRRLVHELWARLAPEDGYVRQPDTSSRGRGGGRGTDAPATPETPELTHREPAGWHDALAALGWGRG